MKTPYTLLEEDKKDKYLAIVAIFLFLSCNLCAVLVIKRQSIQAHFEFVFICRTSDIYFPKSKNKTDIKML